MKKTYSIVKYPSKTLRQRAKEVKNVTDDIREVLNAMADIMKRNQGVGLAATQIGLNIRLAVIDAGGGMLKLVNPVIMKCEGSDIMDEGCLSVPATIVRIKRSKMISVEYIDDNGKKVARTFNGMTAKAIQHEVDHLNGKLILDYLPWFKRVAAVRRMKYI